MAKPTITLPAADPLERGGLLGAIPRLGLDGPPRWIAEGVTFEGGHCRSDVETFRVAVANCADDLFSGDPIDHNDCYPWYEQAAFTMKDRVYNSNLALDGEEALATRLRDDFDRTLSYVFATTLVSATAGITTLPSVATAVKGGTTSTAYGKAVLAAVGDELSRRLGNRTGNIYISATDLANIALEDGEVEWRNGAYRTREGHRIILDAGFTEHVAPGGGAAGSDTYVYGSGPLAYETTAATVNINRLGAGGVSNLINGFIDSFGIFVFDPCAAVVAKV